MDPCIRPVKLTHLDTIITIERGSYTTPWPSSVFVEELQHDWSTMWGFYPDGYRVPVAFLLFWEIYDEMHILNIAVHPEFRRQGIARRLLTSLIEHGRENNFKYVTLEVRESNIAALGLYRSLRFRVEGIRKGYYSDNCEDALIMASYLDNREELACSL
ncbi:MAG: ribosomal protein S18-alanine N-acetyltransferase [Pseudomonadota bacterium]